MNNGDVIRNNIRDFIVIYVKEHGYSPTFQEIGKAIGLKSKSSVSAHIKKDAYNRDDRDRCRIWDSKGYQSARIYIYKN